jgi:Tfp pilus assembly protein PilO
MRYESLVYTYSQILDSYNTNRELPDLIMVNPWAAISNSNTTFLTVDQISTASGTVKSYIETYHQLPTSVTIAGAQVSMPQFLKLTITALLNIEGY